MAESSTPPLARWIGHPEFEAFAAAIAAAPADEAPRLVLADWLQEHGDDAAAELARGPIFPSLLALARFQKTVGVTATEAVSRMTAAFNAAGRAMLPALTAIRRAATVLIEAERRA